MRIAIDARSLLTYYPRGEGRTLLRLYQEIARLRPKWSFVLFGTHHADAGKKACQMIPNSEACTFQIPGFRWNFWENIGLPLAAWHSRADVLHCASSGTPLWSPLPIVMTVHDIIPLIIDDGISPKSVRRFRTRLMAGLRQSRAVISVSHHTKSDLKSYAGGFSEKIKVIHWGVDSNTASFHKRPFSKTVIGFGGGGSIRKNTPTMVTMFAEVAAHDSESELIIIGVTDPDQRQQLESLVTQFSLERRVKLLGYIADKEMEKLIQEAICLVYISLYEGFGLPPLEVMAHGMPVVYADRSSLPEVIGDTGLRVDPESPKEIATAVLRLLQDQKLHYELSQKAWQRARNFTWTKTAEQTIAIFESL